ncbi:MAG: OmpA family protein [Crocinitomicaceae bacterium]|nr:OmpA family protein [Crocinitomicaceae bacterium]
MILLEDKMSSIEKIEAHTVFFPFGKSTIQDAITSHLNIVIAELKKNPTYKIELYGHLDTKEQENASKKPAFADLTKFRVKAVAEYLISKGIESNRIISTPASKSEPNENSSETDDEDLKMAKDRRVMFKVREN